MMGSIGRREKSAQHDDDVVRKRALRDFERDVISTHHLLYQSEDNQVLQGS